MRRTMRSAAPVGGLFALLLLLPTVVAAHDITDVRVDCDGKTIVVSGETFGEAGGTPVTVTVSGPDDYVQTFGAEPVVAWTVSLPLGPSGAYTISWPDPNGGSVTFAVDCPEGTSPPETPSSPPSQPPETPSSPPSHHPTPTPTKTPSHGATNPPHATLPPTDSITPSPVVTRTGTALASLLFIAVLAAAVALRRTAQGRTRRR